MKILIVSSDPLEALAQAQQIMAGAEAELSQQSSDAQAAAEYHDSEATRQRGIRNTASRRAAKVARAMSNLFGM